MMRIGFIAHSPHLAGAERVLINTIKLLHQKYNKNLELHVYVAGQGQLQKIFEHSQIIVHTLKMTSLPWYLGDENDVDIETFFALSLIGKNELKEQIILHGIEILIINTMTMLTPMMVAADLQLPSILWLHGIIGPNLVPDLSKLMKPTLDQLQIQCATKIICPSDWTRAFYSEFRNDIEIIQNFTIVPDTPLPMPTGKTRFICLNTWEKFKGFDILIEAVSILMKSNTHFEVCLYGDGIDKNYLKDLIVSQGVESHVKLMGRVNDISPTFANAHALISASKTESFGMTLIEAFSYGRPVIVSRIAGHMEILGNMENTIGFSCASTDAQAFAEKMLVFMQNPQLLTEMGLAAFKYVTQNFNGQASAIRMKKIIGEQYEKLIHSRDELSQKYNYFNVFKMFQNSQTLGTQIDHLPIPINNHDLIDDRIGDLIPYPLNETDTYQIKLNQDIFDHFEIALGTSQKQRNFNRAKELQHTKTHLKSWYPQLTGTIAILVKISGDESSTRTNQIALKNVRDNSIVRFEFPPILGIRNKLLHIEIHCQSEDQIHIYRMPRSPQTPPHPLRRIQRGLQRKILRLISKLNPLSNSA